MSKIAKFGFLPFSTRLFAFGTAFLLLFGWSARAAEITVPRLEMASRGWVDDGDFQVSSKVALDLAISGGYKYSLMLGFSLEAADIARPDTQAFLGLRVAKATIRGSKIPLALSYFIGSGDDFCTGEDFSTLFGFYPFETAYKGFFYFPEGIGGDITRQYNGIHGARGTGLSLSLTKWDNLVPMLYIYQDFSYFKDIILGTSSVDNLYSGDLRLLFHHDWLRLEAFGGVSMNTSLDFSVRGGLMFYLAGNGAEFFAQAGITGWDLNEKINVDNMFFLIEPRLRFQYFGVCVTFFYHPVEYLHIIEEDEQGIADFNIKFTFGDIESGFTAGIETGVELKIGNLDDYLLRISPFGTFSSGGLLWDTKIRVNPLKFKSPKELLEIFIGVRTAF